MRPQNSFYAWPAGLVLIVSLLQGCGQSTSTATPVAENDSAFLDDLFSEIDLTDAPLPQSRATPTESAKATQPVKVAAMSVPSERLELRLSPGDSFPLVKTVEQVLVQKSELYPASAKTRLELHMLIQVNDVRDDAIQLDVRYGRIVYDQDINGRQISFDSAKPQVHIPPEVIPYAGMVENGFSFWLGKDNRVREVLGYDDFLKRCVQRVPEQQRMKILAGISANFGADSVANFVDDSVGLLPYGINADPSNATKATVGDVWTRERDVMQPVPVKISTTYRLLSLNAHTAKIDIKGILSATGGSPAPQQSHAVKVTGGRSLGSCTVDRRTGLPLELTRSRYLNLVVMTDTGEAVEQEKRIETTIRTYPTSKGAIVQTQRLRTETSAPATVPVPSANETIQQASGTVPSAVRQDPSPRLSSTTRAVYPD